MPRRVPCGVCADGSARERGEFARGRVVRASGGDRVIGPLRRVLGVAAVTPMRLRRGWVLSTQSKRAGIAFMMAMLLDTGRASTSPHAAFAL